MVLLDVLSSMVGVAKGVLAGRAENRVPPVELLGPAGGQELLAGQ